MDKKDYINNIEYLEADVIADGVLNGVVTFNELRATGVFISEKQKLVKRKIKEKEDNIFNQADTIPKLQDYINLFPNGIHTDEATAKIKEIQQAEQKRNEAYSKRESIKQAIRQDINSISVSEILSLDGHMGGDFLEEICREVGIDSNIVRNYKDFRFQDGEVPYKKEELMEDCTDVFFWGVPSSGKTTALAAILNTIKTKYAMEAPRTTKLFGGMYRDSLANMFINDWGYLPNSATALDFTQYMPFILSKRGNKNKHHLSFFELSGEIFRSIYNRLNGADISSESNEIQKAWKTLTPLLESDNKKIHFFFIDYIGEDRCIQNYGLSQTDYLNAAKDYFESHLDIFKKKTDAVYVVVTKADEIEGDNIKAVARDFLEERHGGFMSLIENKCKENGIYFGRKLFSIGDVYFKLICKINRDYSNDIIQTLFNRIPPGPKSGGFWNILNQ